MRCAAVAVVSIGLVAGLVGAAGAQPKGGRFGPNAFSYGWLSSLEQAKARARATGRPLMVVIRCVP